MFLRFSLIFVFMLCFEFGALKSIANIPNSDVSDNSLGNIENFMKFSGINSTNFPSNDINNNADLQSFSSQENMLLSRLLVAVLLLVNRSDCQANDKSLISIDNSVHQPINHYHGPTYIGYSPPVASPPRRTTSTTVQPEEEYLRHTNAYQQLFNPQLRG